MFGRLRCRIGWHSYDPPMLWARCRRCDIRILDFLREYDGPPTETTTSDRRADA